MLISIIIPHYNTPEGLENLLITIPEHKSIEVIVIDDHSHKKPYLKGQLQRNYIIFAENSSKGAGSARNVGLNLASGKWLLFADSDDSFTEDAFEVLLMEADTASEDIVFFPPTSVNTESKLVGVRHKSYESLVRNYIKDSNVVSEKKLRAHFFVPWSKMVRASLIKGEGICFDDVMYSNDLLFSVKVGVLSRSIKAIDKCIYIVSETVGSLTKNDSRNAFDTRLNAAIRYNSFLFENRYGEFTMPLLKYVLWSRKFGLKCFLSTLLTSLTGDNRLINKNWVNWKTLINISTKLRALLK